MKIAVNPERCTGCGRCLAECAAGALSLSRVNTGDRFQILFQAELCDACSRCERACPEHSLRLEERVEEGKEKGAKVVFEDAICRCSGCGAPLFPKAMVKSVEAKIFGAGRPAWSPWSIDLCPSCRLRSSFEVRSV